MAKTAVVNGRKIKLLQADITTLEVEAIVNAANNYLRLGAGVAGAIRKRGGPAIQEECNQIGPIEVGEAAITGAGNLPCNYIIHAASMGDEPVSERSLRASVQNSFKRAEEKGIKTIAFPAIGSGIGGFPVEQCAQIMLKEIIDHLHDPKCTLEEVTFALFSDKDLQVFEAELSKMTHSS